MAVAACFVSSDVTVVGVSKFAAGIFTMDVSIGVFKTTDGMFSMAASISFDSVVNPGFGIVSPSNLRMSVCSNCGCHNISENKKVNYNESDNYWNNIKDPDGQIRNITSEEEKKFKMKIPISDEKIISKILKYFSLLAIYMYIYQS